MNDIAELGLTTNQLLDQIERELGLTLDRNTITAWTRRADMPMPIAYRGKPGQGHRYDWLVVKPWLEAEIARTSNTDGQDIDAMDWAQARTVKERERAKQAQMDTLSRSGAVGSIHVMELEAENLGRQAVEMLLVIPDRIAPQIAAEDDEVRCYQIIDEEMRRVCNKIADLGAHNDGTL
jgi:phage terminase Nu1 subunit (DNA packaging protein)